MEKKKATKPDWKLDEAAVERLTAEEVADLEWAAGELARIHVAQEAAANRRSLLSPAELEAVKQRAQSYADVRGVNVGSSLGDIAAEAARRRANSGDATTGGISTSRDTTPVVTPAKSEEEEDGAPEVVTRGERRTARQNRAFARVLRAFRAPPPERSIWRKNSSKRFFGDDESIISSGTLASSTLQDRERRFELLRRNARLLEARRRARCEKAGIDPERDFPLGGKQVGENNDLNGENKKIMKAEVDWGAVERELAARGQPDPWSTGLPAPAMRHSLTGGGDIVGSEEKNTSEQSL